MHPFEFYLKLGFDHIADMAAYDHILFLVVLCAVYRIEQWKKILILVTAFTIGHSITLVLVSLDIFSIPSNLIKFLIPATIFITALHNVIGPNTTEKSSRMNQNYSMALFFGLIHGMDFSNYFKALIMDPTDIVIPLLGFNIGIELGQLLVVLFIVGVAFLFLNILRVKHREWNVFISGAAAGMSLISMLENTFW
ncbi:HupE/UreJ family protein [Muricauda sp. SCSIO 64092]|uniref:HupE/UreJ family protein n=1 Tax=Allomuricauda sp. SCSIO 64092 TaxID=2908842 RepID=UPI001FF36D29|nr:HupE/UreJ family protein [Muricauda sp. SCSIO 64092]UOY06334.1 HupE/UreJ family protein [Muricauda sp. SCSIO 64092]